RQSSARADRPSHPLTNRPWCSTRRWKAHSAGVQSLRSALPEVGLGPPFSWMSSITGPRPKTLIALLRACRPPRLAEWTNPERSAAENQDWTEELNGLVTDGHNWYASCNAD